MSSHVDAKFLAELPDFNLFLGRLSLAMSRGEPAAKLAWLRADPSYPDSATFQIGRIDALDGESETTKALRARGLVHDRISRKMLAGATIAEGSFVVGTRRYRALILDPLEIAKPALAESIAAIAEAGIPVVALGALPERAPGLRARAQGDGLVREAVKRLSKVILHPSESDPLEALLAEHVEGVLVEPASGESLAVSLEHRRGETWDTLLIFNESWSPTKTRLRFVRGGSALTLWNPRTGSREVLRDIVSPGDVVPIALEAVETLILTLESSRERH